MKPWTLHVQFLRSMILAGAILSVPAISSANDIDVDSRIRSLEQRLAELQESVRDARQIRRIFAGSDRSNETFSDVFGAHGFNSGDTGYYVGAGLDLVYQKICGE